ncbi:hypothetical protein C7B64_09910 [Merismopedia glauca CCAP 1448/3]|uniref:Uncharacterized protein n=1 Tax=Merismopedia glauca CCAP 1448/3 TaxID=1296344 RepID=A0A2T1C4N0_9CYAN|nr:hypothetical protein C7B64_09910 [Merismopedia glauca CCAP 1448/3]
MGMVWTIDVNVEQGIVGAAAEADSDEGLWVLESVPQVSMFDGVVGDGLPVRSVVFVRLGFDEVMAMGEELAEPLPPFIFGEMGCWGHYKFSLLF